MSSPNQTASNAIGVLLESCHPLGCLLRKSKMYLAVLWICVRVFGTDLGNGFCISSKYASLEKGDFKEIVKGDKYVQTIASVLTSNFVLYR